MKRAVRVLCGLTVAALAWWPLTALAADLATRHRLADGLESPTNLTATSDGRIFVVEPYEGRIRVIEDGVLRAEPFLSLGERMEERPHVEGGLLGVAFPPDYRQSRQFYITYTDAAGALRLSRFTADPAGTTGRLDSEDVILSIPERDYRWHNCGHIEFAADGLLYMCVGDMDGPGNPSGSAQDLERLKGKIFRIDPRLEARPEILAYGLRNPWGFTVLPSGDLVIPDAGFETWEELNLLPADQPQPVNFGWNLAEANDCRVGDCAGELVWPIYAYPHDGLSCAIIGGAVYTGSLAAWRGVYLFGDYCSGTVLAIRNLRTDPEIRTIAEGFTQIGRVGRDADGEIIVSDFGAGAVDRLELPADAGAGWTNVADLIQRQALAARRSGLHSSKNDLEKLLNSQRWAVASKAFALFDMIMGGK